MRQYNIQSKQEEIEEMIKGKFMVKNQKKLVIQREGKQIQNKKYIENQKCPSKHLALMINENLSQNNLSKLHQKPQSSRIKHLRRRTLTSSRMSTQSPQKQSNSKQNHENFIRKSTIKLKSCYNHPKISNQEYIDDHNDQINANSMKTEYIKKIINFLKFQGWIKATKFNQICMKQQHFSKVLHIIADNLLGISQEEKQFDSRYALLKKTIKDIKQSLNLKFHKTKRQSLKIVSNTIFHQYNSHQYKHEENNIAINLSKLLQEQRIIGASIKQMEQHLSSLSQECDVKQEKHNQLQRQIYSLSSFKVKIIQQLNKLTMSLKETNHRYNTMIEKEENIFNYVMKQENNKIIKLVSEDYKQIQSDIYEFAVYLQSNQLASNIHYEPHPYSVIEKEIMEQMKNVNKTLIQESVLSLTEKYKIMRDFILKANDKFKKKDDQMTRLCDFKTKCIKKFVSQMKKWLNNWELKQEYLKNLRKEFGIDSNALWLKIQELDKNSEEQPNKQMLLNQIKSIFQKIEVNYKLGNSFY